MSDANRLPTWLQSQSSSHSHNNQPGWLVPARVVMIAFLITAGVVAVGWGLARLVELSEVPFCWQPAVAQAKASQPVTIELSGAVAKPGVYQLEASQRLADAVEQAGGFTQEAASSYLAQSLNLAAKIEDGQKIYVPSREELLAAQPTPTQAQNKDIQSAGAQSAALLPALTPAPQTVQAATGKISLNQAAQSELESLNGIGPKRAAGIIENRPFTKVEQLLDMKLVPQSVFAEIESQIAL